VSLTIYIIQKATQPLQFAIHDACVSVDMEQGSDLQPLGYQPNTEDELAWGDGEVPQELPQVVQLAAKV
jgi:hypothetical protein